MNFFTQIEQTQILRRALPPVARPRPCQSDLRARAIARAAIREMLD